MNKYNDSGTVELYPLQNNNNDNDDDDHNNNNNNINNHNKNNNNNKQKKMKKKHQKENQASVINQTELKIFHRDKTKLSLSIFLVSANEKTALKKFASFILKIIHLLTYQSTLGLITCLGLPDHLDMPRNI